MKIIRKVGTKTAIEKNEFGGEPKDVRGYLGMSSCGEECQRKRWYGFHFANFKKHKARTERIFNIGHLFEQVAIADLKSVGCKIFRIEKNKRIELFGLKEEKQESLSGATGHEGGHPDGRITGVLEAPKTEHLLELKTMKAEFFKVLVKEGVEKSNPNYYAQMQRYMSAMKLTRALFIAINKNTCEYHFERICFNKREADDLIRKELDVILTDRPPAKHYPKGFYKCHDSWCHFSEICRGESEPLENCRTCEYSDMENGGAWLCKEKGCFLSVNQQLAGCEEYKKGWEL